MGTVDAGKDATSCCYRVPTESVVDEWGESGGLSSTIETIATTHSAV